MSETRQLGIVLVVIGGLLLVGGAFAYSYAKTNSISASGITIPLGSTYPYRDDGYGLILGSVALFVVGFAFMIYQPQNSPQPRAMIYNQRTRTTQGWSGMARNCPVCNNIISSDYNFCPFCTTDLRMRSPPPPKTP
jgi:hypothetical protein